MLTPLIGSKTLAKLLFLGQAANLEYDGTIELYKFQRVSLVYGVDDESFCNTFLTRYLNCSCS